MSHYSIYLGLHVTWLDARGLHYLSSWDLLGCDTV